MTTPDSGWSATATSLRTTWSSETAASAVALHGNRNVLSGNRANGNCLAGSCAGAYVVGGRSNQVSRNLATGEQTGIVLLSDATSTSVSRNRIRHGLDGGILVDQGATGNVLRGNVVQQLWHRPGRRQRQLQREHVGGEHVRDQQPRLSRIGARLA